MASQGFGAGDSTSPGEYGRVSLFFDPLQRDFLNPILYLDLSCSLFPFDPDRFAGGVRVGISLFTWKNHPAMGFFEQRNWYTPSVAVGVKAALDGGVLRYTVEGHPLRIRTGDAFYSHLAPTFLFDENFSLVNWGIGLFQYSFFLF